MTTDNVTPIRRPRAVRSEQAKRLFDVTALVATAASATEDDEVNLAYLRYMLRSAVRELEELHSELDS